MAGLTSDGPLLEVWTVYDHPADFPDEFVARKFVVDHDGARATDEIMRAPLLYLLRERLALRWLSLIPRDESDDPVIVESWI